jgi:hypothetical protein
MGSGEEVLAVEIGHRLRNGKGKLAMGTAISDLMEYSQRSSSIAPISLFFSTLKVPALRQAENKETIPEYAPQLKLFPSAHAHAHAPDLFILINALTATLSS